MNKSIIQDTKQCYVCGSVKYLHLHHIIFGKNRKKADEDGLVVYLCYNHHEGTTGIHGKKGHDLDLKLKQIAEQRWLEYYNKDVNDFINRYGRSYL